MTIQKINDQFGIDGCVEIFEGSAEQGSFPLIRIKNHAAEALVSLYGGHLLSYKLKGRPEALFLSNRAIYKQGKAIRGGIPICWPWFGNDPEGKGRAAHGFARTTMWSVCAAEDVNPNETHLTLKLESSPETKKIWDHDFSLMLEISVGETLKVGLRTQNKGEETFVVTQALHTYFSINDISNIRVEGLDGCRYLEKVHGGEATQSDEISFEEEVDRIYLDPPTRVQITEAGLPVVDIVAEGSASTVVWNPWIDKTASMGDLEPESYKKFVCVETTNAATDEVQVAGRGECYMSAEYKF